MKKIISLFTALCLIISAFPVCVAASDDVDTYIIAEQLIEKLDILSDLSSSETISRGEFTKAAVKLMGMGDVANSSKTTAFTDVSSESNIAPYVNIAYDLMWISPSSDGCFNPDAPVKYNEAVKILVCALKCRDRAEATGGFPGGYLSVANRLKLLRGVEEKSGILTKSNAILMMYNVLMADYMEISAISANSTVSYAQNGKTVLEEIFDIYVLKAQVLCAGITNIMGTDTIEPGRVSLMGIDDGYLYNVYDEDNILAHNAGEQMEIYLKYNATKNNYFCVAAFPFDETVEIFDGKDIFNFQKEKGRFTFFADSVSDKKLKYNYDSDIAVILNDVYQYDTRPVFDILAQKNSEYNIDNLKLIDINSDGVCDVLSLYAYKNYIADSADPVWDKVRVRDDEELLDIDREKNDVYRYDGTDVITNFIVTDTVISVFERPVDEQYIKNTVYLGNEYVEGVVSEIDYDTYSVSVAGKELVFSTEARDTFDTIDVNVEYRFHTDYRGRVANVKKIQANNDLEGYFVTDKFYIEANGLKRSLNIKAFDMNHGVLKEMSSDDKVEINGNIYSLSDDRHIDSVNSLLDGVNLLYMQFSSDGKIKSVKVPSETTGDFRYATGKKGPVNMTYKSSRKTLYQAVTDTAGAYNVLTDLYRTKVVVAPSDKDISDEMKEMIYKNTTTDYFVNDIKYDVEGFVLNEYGIMSDIVIVHVNSDKHSPIVTKTAVFVVDYVTSAINLAGNQGKRVVGYQAGQPRSYVSKDEVFRTTGGEVIDLKPGDVFKPQLDVYGDLSGVEMVYKADKNTLSSNDAHKYASSARVYKGIVYNVDEVHFSVIADSQLPYINDDVNGRLNSYSGSNYMYYIDLEKPAGQRVRNGTTSDMKSYVRCGMDATEVIAMTRYGDVATVVIFE